MIDLKITAAGLAFVLALAGAATPALAKDRAARAGYDARAEAIGDIGVAPSRAEALRACSGEASKLVEYTWGAQETDIFRACMAGRGQPE